MRGEWFSRGIEEKGTDMNKNHYRMPAVLLLVCLLSSMCFCGCRKGSQFSVDDTLKHLKDRYGEEFTYVEDYDAFQPAGGGYEFYVSCKSIPDQKIYVKVIRDGQGFRYVDNYLAAKYFADTETAIRKLAEAVYGSDINLIFRLTKNMAVADSDVDPDMTLQDFWTNEKFDLSCCVKIKPDQGLEKKDAKLDILEKLIKAAKMYVRFSIYYMNSETAYINDSTSPAAKDYDEHAILEIGEGLETKMKEWNR